MSQILVVDDSSTVRHEVSEFLRSHDFTVSTAVDGHDGLRKLDSDGDIRLVIADINMPGMDGITMVEKIRVDLNNNVKIIMLTTESDSKIRHRAKEFDVSGWIVKPFCGAHAVEGIRKLVS